jgi:hypothetical protein
MLSSEKQCPEERERLAVTDEQGSLSTQMKGSGVWRRERPSITRSANTE